MSRLQEAQDVMRDVKNALADEEERLRQHPYIDILNSGEVRIEALHAFPGHQFHMWRSDMRSVAAMVQRFGDRPYVGFFNDDLQGEIAARDGIVLLAAKLGMSEQDLEDHEPTADGFAYSAYVTWLAVYGSAAEVACGLSVNLAAWGYNCGRVSEALRAHYGLVSDDTVFLDSFADLPSFDDIATEIIADDLGRGVEPPQIMRAARLIQAYEGMFWDAMARIAEGS